MNKKELERFLIEARTKTYAGDGGKVKPTFKDSTQLEFEKGDFLYRDVYYVGNGIFAGLETVYFKEKPVFSMSYFGNFKGMSEEEVDKILRKALTENREKARLWYDVNWKEGKYKYECSADMKGGIDEIGGSESISKNDKQIYYLYYAGGIIG